jgi:hypothetical protein
MTDNLCLYISTPYGLIPLVTWVAYRAATQR